MSMFTGNIGREEEDGLGWGGLVPTARERREERERERTVYLPSSTSKQLRELAKQYRVSESKMVALLIQQAINRELQLTGGSDERS